MNEFFKNLFGIAWQLVFVLFFFIFLWDDLNFMPKIMVLLDLILFKLSFFSLLI